MLNICLSGQKSSATREIDLFIDGVQNCYKKLNFDEIFNEFGLVTHMSHREDVKKCVAPYFSGGWGLF